jgi:LCP family protein required for cell wall assembly
MMAVMAAGEQQLNVVPDGTDTHSEPVPDAAPPKRGKHRRLRWIAISAALLLLVVIGGAAGTFYYFVHAVDSRVGRVQVFDQIPARDRPQKAAVAADAMNYLILGSDSRDLENTTGSRSDTIILLHINKGHTRADLVSIPRDSWVHIPKSPSGPYGNTNAKINAAYAWGGVPLTVQTVEQFTGVYIDHVVLIDFAGFKEIIDALGGVEINVEKSFTSSHSLTTNSIRHFNAGPQLLDGAAALDYARERYAFADGDFTRIRHQQQLIRAVLDRAASSGLPINPAKLDAFLEACAASVVVDSTLNILKTARALRHLGSADLRFYTNPSSGTGRVGSQSVVFPDRARAKEAFDAIRLDRPLPASIPAN